MGADLPFWFSSRQPADKTRTPVGQVIKTSEDFIPPPVISRREAKPLQLEIQNVFPNYTRSCSSILQAIDRRLHNSLYRQLELIGCKPMFMAWKLCAEKKSFSGLIPGSLGNLSSLQGALDLSHNLFNGPIPASLGNLPKLVYINLTCNNLSGAIPQNGALMNVGPAAFIGNPLLCGPPLKTRCPSAASIQISSLNP
ncbi:hypothetical protein NC653_038847 [Populus alba x Populus x berolinensis]|uniref:Uncharacterized protein n=1 Tax=Populus alba x Populus x berolinensis TaxID=444605 RepID=A0AAD6LKE7_9ROSI|nr:hypothetical protein NC653_038847 [Populus alba x Populus x berolinensis]